MHANVPLSMRAQHFEFISTDRNGGTRFLKGKIFAKGEEGLLRLMMRVLEPRDLAGSAYLLRESPPGKQDEVYVLLPGINRVKSITGLQAGQSLFGTDFSYVDIRQIQVGLSGGENTLEESSGIEGRQAHVLVQKPKDPKSSPYSMTRSWVDKETCVVLRSEFSENDKPRKLLTAPVSALTQAGKYWYLSEMEMRDLKENTKTVLKVQLAPGEKDLSRHYFNSNTFGIISP